jgi:Uri superfamily endonuclease
VNLPAASGGVPQEDDSRSPGNDNLPAANHDLPPENNGLPPAHDRVPPLPGSYALQLVVKTAQPALRIGRLGAFDFPTGVYLYLGSARGPGGLRARLAHHRRLAAHPHWHLDFLRSQAELIGVWYSPILDPLECAWSQALLDLPGASLPAPGFGAADCRLGCLSHLVAFTGGLPQGLLDPVLKSFAGPLYWLTL